ncbi:MAG: phosphoenolpyruvate--protein phosphotransferase [Clostridiales bacterium]|nr:phosphoenolpyruvate--protein phosphotransferase [Clostridiales bacterium]
MFHGIGASHGYGIGNVFIIKEQSLDFTPRINCNPQIELKRYYDAVETFCENALIMAEKMTETVGKSDAEILSGHIYIIKDPYLILEVERRIKEGKCAESSLCSVCDLFVMLFSTSEDELTKQRASDIYDVKTGVLSLLIGADDINISSAPPNSVLVTRDLTPSMTASIKKENIAGIITENGGKTSHSAILARAMGIPAVLSVNGFLRGVEDNDTVIVDGVEGKVIINPRKALIDEYTKKRDVFLEEKKSLFKYVDLETETADGKKINLFGNIDTPDDTDDVIRYGGEGVGLFRTEFLFVDRKSAPSEKEQFYAYKKVALKMNGKPVIIRTLDVGGDKVIPYLRILNEDNPFLGFRAIRYCLKNKTVFTQQLRALLMASAFGNLQIMIPLITDVSEFRQVKNMIKDIMDELDSKEIPYDKNIKVGITIETPSAAIVADLLAKEADFFSIGTNDLIQYILAVDRGNSNVAYIYSTYQPAVLRSIKSIIEVAKREGIPVGMCGEAASDSLIIPLLISFGLDDFSVSSTSILNNRKEISKWTKGAADKVAKKALQQSTEEEVFEVLKRAAL